MKDKELEFKIQLIVDDMGDYWRSDRWQYPMKTGDKTFQEQLLDLIAQERRKAKIEELESVHGMVSCFWYETPDGNIPVYDRLAELKEDKE